jgi:hypothetical protein
MTNNTRTRYTELATAAAQSFERLGLSPLDVAPDQYQTVRRLADDVVAQTGCTLESARKHINRILRARDNYERATWGGARTGAGRRRKDAV